MIQRGIEADEASDDKAAEGAANTHSHTHTHTRTHTLAHTRTRPRTRCERSPPSRVLYPRACGNGPSKPKNKTEAKQAAHRKAELAQAKLQAEKKSQREVYARVLNAFLADGKHRLHFALHSMAYVSFCFSSVHAFRLSVGRFPAPSVLVRLLCPSRARLCGSAAACTYKRTHTKKKQAF